MTETHVAAPSIDGTRAPSARPPSSTRGPSAFAASALATLPLPIAWIGGQLVAGVLKGSNPDNVDVTQGLAYLRPILITAGVLFAIVWVVALVVALGRRRRGDTLPVKLLALHTVVAVALLLSNAYADRAANG